MRLLRGVCKCLCAGAILNLSLLCCAVPRLVRSFEEGDQPECTRHKEVGGGWSNSIADRGEPVEKGYGD